MKIKWYGHSAFRLISGDGVTIIIDPYQSAAYGDELTYAPIDDRADVVLVSHNHNDHNGSAGIKGTHRDLQREGTLTAEGVRIGALPAFHDTTKGRERGRNLLFVIDMISDGLRVAHLGDLGHLLDDDTIEGIGRVDVLMIPVGGFFTIDAETATKVMKSISPWITIPMHFKTEKTQFPITGVETFAGDKENVKRMSVSEVDITKATLPKEPEILVLRHAQ